MEQFHVAYELSSSGCKSLRVCALVRFSLGQLPLPLKDQELLF